jgi:hypothetical protein
MQGPKIHVEIMLEKNALRTVIRLWRVNASSPPAGAFPHCHHAADLARRFKQSGKARLVLLMLTGFDPDGDEIAASLRGHLGMTSASRTSMRSGRADC